MNQAALVAFGLGVIASAAHAAPVTLQNATATFSQANFPVGEAINGVIGTPAVSPVFDGWAIFGSPTATATASQTAVFETATDVGGPLGASFTFTLHHTFDRTNVANEDATTGKFRLSVTTDPRTVFADGLSTGGDVTATWTPLAVLTAAGTDATGGTDIPVLTINPLDSTVLASGPSPETSVYTITATTTLTGITGIRLEVLEDPSLPTSGPGRSPSNGNLTISELQVDAVNLVPEPASLALLAAGAVAALMRKR